MSFKARSHKTSGWRSPVFGANATGFMMFEYNLCGKWLELLKEIAPRVTRAAVIRDVAMPRGPASGALQSVAPSFGIELSPVNMRDVGEIERAVAAFARSQNGGMILTGSALAVVHRDLIVTLAARHKLPTVYYSRSFVTGGGLISYGPDAALALPIVAFVGRRQRDSKCW